MEGVNVTRVLGAFCLASNKPLFKLQAVLLHLSNNHGESHMQKEILDA